MSAVTQKKAKWEESLHVDIRRDPYVTGKFGFELWTDDDFKLFASQLVYSTEQDAENAGEDAAHAAWLYRNR